MSVELRPAGPGHLDEVVQVFLRCWTISYRDVLPVDDLGHWDEPRASALWRPHLAPDQASRVTVALVDGSVQGVIRYEPADQAGLIHSLYVDPEAAGLGLGRRLVEAAVRHLELSGCPRTSLWVFSANTAAQGFYRQLGFADDGRRIHEPPYLSELTGMTR
jgi:ribosomal protein S18 acetylase RimI-like enzyme